MLDEPPSAGPAVSARPGGRQYGIPKLFMVRWAGSAFGGRRRSLGSDAAELLQRSGVRAAVHGLERVPDSRGLVVVMNHYDRPGLRVWWPGLLVSMLLWRLRPSNSIRWMVANRWEPYRLGPVLIPRKLIAGFPYLLVRTYGAVIVPRQPELARDRALALRRAARALRSEHATTIAVTPELVGGLETSLSDPWPNAGAALAFLSRGRVPILPVGVFEGEAGQLVAQFGAPFTLEWRPPHDRPAADALNEEVMRSLAALLPSELRGTFDTTSEAYVPADG